MTDDRNELFIGSAWRPPSSSNRITVRSASTEQVIGSVPEAREADVDAAVDAARRAFDDPGGWATWEPERRAEILDRLDGEQPPPRKRWRFTRKSSRLRSRHER